MAKAPAVVEHFRGSQKAAGRKPSKKAEVTRRRILQAAAEAFAKNGYQLALLTEIAKTAGVHVTALYYYFDTKEHLVEEMLNRFVISTNRTVAAQVRALPPDASFRDKIATAAIAHLKVTLSETNNITAHSRVLYQVPQEVRDRHLVFLRKGFLFWRALVKGAWESGEIRRDLDPTIATQILMGSLNWAQEWYKPGRKAPEDIAVEAVSIMFDGMSPRSDGLRRKNRRHAR